MSTHEKIVQWLKIVLFVLGGLLALYKIDVIIGLLSQCQMK